MSLNKDNAKVKVYLWIAFAYFFLWDFAELISNPQTIFQRVWNQFWLNMFLLFFNYILIEYTLPFILRSWKRYFTAPFLICAHVIINTFGLYLWRALGIKLNFYFELTHFENIYIGVQNVAGIGVFSLFFYPAAIHIYNYRKLKQSERQLTLEKKIAELNFLKSQINPHFLFNTLNNIYSLAKDSSPKAPEAILKLSEILRFILYEAGGKSIPVEREIKLINDYIELEKLRYDSALKINFSCNIDAPGTLVHPLLLIPLVENAFKHGVSETLENPFIDIDLKVQKRVLEFRVINSTDKTEQTAAQTDGIGISNLKRQLELLNNKYDLKLAAGENKFTAYLKINLS